MSDWGELRARRLAEPGAMAEYDAAELAFELGAALRGLREERNWSQSLLAEAARTTQPVVARLEAGGAVPTVAVLQRVARALDMRLAVTFRKPRVDAAVTGAPAVAVTGSPPAGAVPGTPAGAVAGSPPAVAVTGTPAGAVAGSTPAVAVTGAPDGAVPGTPAAVVAGTPADGQVSFRGQMRA